MDGRPGGVPPTMDPLFMDLARQWDQCSYKNIDCDICQLHYPAKARQCIRVNKTVSNLAGNRYKLTEEQHSRFVSELQVVFEVME